MALQPCRSCGHDVSEDAESCPQCGAPYPAEGEKTAHRLVGSKEREAATSGVLFGVGVVVFILLVIAVYLRWKGVL